MICENCGQFVEPIKDEFFANRTARRREYVCQWCGHKGDQWDSLQPGEADIIEKEGG